MLRADVLGFPTLVGVRCILLSTKIEGFFQSGTEGHGSLRMAAEWPAAGVFGSTVPPEMRLTVSFCITYTLRPVWAFESALKCCILFAYYRVARPLSSRKFRPTVEVAEIPRRN